jgi:hypothetical protein
LTVESWLGSTNGHMAVGLVLGASATRTTPPCLGVPDALPVVDVLLLEQPARTAAIVANDATHAATRTFLELLINKSPQHMRAPYYGACLRSPYYDSRSTGLSLPPTNAYGRAKTTRMLACELVGSHMGL